MESKGIFTAMVSTVALLLTGNWLIVACCAVYIAWWSIGFNPMRSFPFMPKLILFLVTLGLGIAGIVVDIIGMASSPPMLPVIPNWLIVIFGVVLYIILLYVTGRFLHRPATTELLLIVFWLTLQVCLLNSSFAAGYTDGSAFWACFGIDVLAAILGMVSYLRYYELPKKVAFYTGMVPLALFGFAMVVTNVLLAS